jgi:hypothetical protein
MTAIADCHFQSELINLSSLHFAILAPFCSMYTLVTNFNFNRNFCYRPEDLLFNCIFLLSNASYINLTSSQSSREYDLYYYLQYLQNFDKSKEYYLC